MTAPPDVLVLQRLPTPIGLAVLVTDQGDALRAFDWSEFEPKLAAHLARRYPTARRAEGRSPVAEAFEAYFAGELSALARVPWRAAGTAFQQAVWRALCDIPAGETRSYAALAAAIGRPSAVRAVGLANGSNPVALAAPCHRVIGADGSLTGYGGGLHRKRWLLRHEGAAFNERRVAA